MPIDADQAPRLGVIQLGGGGHRFAYVRVLAEHGSGPTVLVTTPEAQRGEDFVLHLGDLWQEGRLEVVHHRPARGRLGGARELRRMARCLRDVDVIVVPGGDKGLPLCCVLLATTRRPSINALLFRPARPLRYHPSLSAALRGWVKIGLALSVQALSRHRLRFLQLDLPGECDSELLFTRTLRTVNDYAAPAEPVSTPPTSTIVLAGALEPRKGVAEIVDVWSTVPIPERLQLVGQIGAAVDARTRRRLADLVADGRAEVVDRYVSETELDQALGSSVATLLPYDLQTWSSGILARAVRLEVPVIVIGPDSGIASLVRRYGLGIHIDRFARLPSAIEELKARRPELVENLRRHQEQLDDGSRFAASLSGRATG